MASALWNQAVSYLVITQITKGKSASSGDVDIVMRLRALVICVGSAVFFPIISWS